jgi:hypothetical protein
VVARRVLRFPILEETDTGGHARLFFVRLSRAAVLVAQAVLPAHHADPRMRRNSPQLWVRDGNHGVLGTVGIMV